MNKNILKSIGAILIGFVVTVLLSIGTDMLLIRTGSMKQPFDDNSGAFIWFVIAYRTLYNIAGSSLAARMAPGRPMRHAMILGLVGSILGMVGLIVMWNEPPHWYPITLIILAIPSAWLGGKINPKYEKKYHRNTHF